MDGDKNRCVHACVCACLSIYLFIGKGDSRSTITIVQIMH